MSNLRVRVARAILGVSRFLDDVPLLVMTADDLVEFSRQGHRTPHDIGNWSADHVVDAGLNDAEAHVAAALPVEGRRLLLCGLGGGREAVALVRAGFTVTGVDYSAEMVDRAVQVLARRGVALETRVEDVASLQPEPASYDVVWLSHGLYSCIPTRARRVRTLRRLRDALRPDGGLVCCFCRQPTARGAFASAARRRGGARERMRRVLARAMLGNADYQEGDTLWQRFEFAHFFASEAELIAEVEEGGLRVADMYLSPNRLENAALLFDARTAPRAVTHRAPG